MEHVNLEVALALLNIALLVVCVIFGALAIYQAFFVFAGVAPGKRTLANLFPYLLGPKCLTPVGQKAYHSFVRYASVAALAAAGSAGIFHYLGRI